MRLPLHDTHAALGARFVERRGIEVPEGYGDWRDEHEAARKSVGLIDCCDAGRLHGSGPDVAQVLQGVVTNEVKHLPGGRGCLAALLNDVGRTQTLLVMLRIDEGFLIETPPGLSEKSRGLIDYYIITEDAAIEDETDCWGQLSLQGPGARELLAGLVAGELPPLDQPAFTHTSGKLDGHSIRIVRYTRTGEDGYDIWVPADGLQVAWERLHAATTSMGGRSIGRAALDVLRVEAAIPAYGVDLDDTTIPLEAGLSDAISENKGCYLGQEIIARITNLSKPVRVLTVLLPQAPVAPGDKVLCDEKEVGWVTSAVDSPTLQCRVALAYVRTDVIERGGKVAVNEAPAEIRRAPLYRSDSAPVTVVPPSPARQRVLPGIG